jgi:hypothetical protein
MPFGRVNRPGGVGLLGGLRRVLGVVASGGSVVRSSGFGELGL